MSAFGPKRTSLAAPHMSAFGGKADMTFCTGQRINVLGFAATYTEIYARISAGLQALGATVTVCGRMSLPPR
jgi:hypothetical protein